MELPEMVLDFRDRGSGLMANGTEFNVSGLGCSANPDSALSDQRNSPSLVLGAQLYSLNWTVIPCNAPAKRLFKRWPRAPMVSTRSWKQDKTTWGTRCSGFRVPKL